jgi:hypothetical protein
MLSKVSNLSGARHHTINEEKKRRQDTATTTSRRIAVIQRKLMARPFPRSLPLVAERALDVSVISDIQNYE